MSETRPDAGFSLVGWLQIAAIGAIIILAIVLTMILSSKPDAGAPVPLSLRMAVPVELVVPARTDHTIQVSTTGTVTAKAFVQMTPQVGGRVIALSPAVREGGRFGAGEVLFEIDPRDYEVAVARAGASLADARSALQQLEAEAEIARREWESAYPDRDITPLAAREPQLAAARARVASAQADIRQAQLSLERTQVTYPFEGRVTDSRIELGQVLAPGQAYGTVYSLAELELVAPASPSDVARLAGAEGRSVEIQVEGRSGPLSGVVVREGADLDARSRFINLFIAVDDREQLRPGLFASVVIEGPALERVLRLPERAVAGLSEVSIVRDGKIETLQIEVLDRIPGSVFTTPFDFGDGVIVTPLPEGATGRDANVLATIRDDG